MGRVFRGQDKVTGQVVAVKFPLEETGWGPEAARRFEREIAALRSLDHPNVVRFLSSGTEGGRRYYVMEWAEGENLARVLAECRALAACLPFDRVHSCFRQLCLGLQALHDRGLVHRDVKPANIMWLMPAGSRGGATAIEQEPRIKLIDLGVAKNRGPKGHQSTVMTGAAGTLEYMAPEQAMAGVVDHRADIFAVGLVTYEMLTRFLPRGNVRRPSAVNGTVPPWFDDLLLQMMEQDPSARPSAIGPLAERGAPATPAGSAAGSTIPRPPGVDAQGALWFYGHSRQKVGPFSLAQLRQLLTVGQLAPTDMVSKKGTTNWVPAEIALGLVRSDGQQKVFPDRNREPDAEQKMRELNDADEAPAGPNRRQAYDAARNQATPTNGPQKTQYRRQASASQSNGGPQDFATVLKKLFPPVKVPLLNHGGIGSVIGIATLHLSRYITDPLWYLGLTLAVAVSAAVIAWVRVHTLHDAPKSWDSVSGSERTGLILRWIAFILIWTAFIIFTECCAILMTPSALSRNTNLHDWQALHERTER
jgi:serine/threonine protein kinase